MNLLWPEKDITLYGDKTWSAEEGVFRTGDQQVVMANNRIVDLMHISKQSYYVCLITDKESGVWCKIVNKNTELQDALNSLSAWFDTAKCYVFSVLTSPIKSMSTY